MTPAQSSNTILTQRYTLRGYDAVQLAVAISTQRLLEQGDFSMIFVSADNQLVQAAQAVGLTTDNPFDHADLDAP